MSVEVLPGGVRVLEADAFADLPGLRAGITVRAADGGGHAGPDDFGLSTGGPLWSVAERYEALAAGLGFGSVSVCRQEHGTELVEAALAPPRGFWIPGTADGFAGLAPAGRLFAVTVADCVPVHLVHPASRTLGLLHAGWRGAAAGILGRALGLLDDRYGAPAAELRMHLGPAICGDCYEVGPEVPRAFGRQAEGKTTLDVGAELAREAEAAGVPAGGISRSALCTRCDGALLHSHRGGGARAGRMAAWLGWTA